MYHTNLLMCLKTQVLFLKSEENGDVFQVFKSLVSGLVLVKEYCRGALGHSQIKVRKCCDNFNSLGASNKSFVVVQLYDNSHSFDEQVFL